MVINFNNIFLSCFKLLNLFFDMLLNIFISFHTFGIWIWNIHIYEYDVIVFNTNFITSKFSWVNWRGWNLTKMFNYFLCKNTFINNSINFWKFCGKLLMVLKYFHIFLIFLKYCASFNHNHSFTNLWKKKSTLIFENFRKCAWLPCTFIFN